MPPEYSDYTVKWAHHHLLRPAAVITQRNDALCSLVYDVFVGEFKQLLLVTEHLLA